MVRCCCAALFAATVVLPSAFSAPLVFDATSLDFEASFKPHFEQLVVFGDSLSDDGTGAWRLTNKMWPADPHYSRHRFTNGRLYHQHIAEHFSIPVSHSFGGATTNNTLVQGWTGPAASLQPVDSLLDQVGAYLETLAFKGVTEVQNTLFVVYGGGNNAIFGNLDAKFAQETVRDLATAVRLLKAVGGKHFLLPTLPPLEASPAHQLPSFASQLSRFGTTVRKQLVQFAKSDPMVVVVDYYSTYKTLFADPARHGFDPAKLHQSCLKGVYGGNGNVTACTNPGEYFWWDEYHPTKRVHAIMGKAAIRALEGKEWA